MRNPTVCLISSGIRPSQVRLQPWRYLHETARQLGVQGHDVTIISDGDDAPVVEGVTVRRVPGVVSTVPQPNEPLEDALADINPDVIVWHVGATSFLPHRTLRAAVPTVGVFTSPLYTRHELARLGLRRLVKGYKLSAMHVAGALLPSPLLRRGIAGSGLDRLVTQTRATRDQLVERGVRSKDIAVVAPGVDPAWERPRFAPHDLRQRLGYGPDNTVVVYFGSPAPLRGLHTLIAATRQAREAAPSLKLLVLSRRRADELLAEDADLARLLGEADAASWVQVVSGFLPEEVLVEHVAAADLVALPFELVPSDAPLSILEAQALGKPIVVSTVRCLPELAAAGPTYLAQPANATSLAGALVRATLDQRQRIERCAGPPAFPNRSWRAVGEEWSRLVESL